MDRDKELESQAEEIIDDMLLSGSDGTLPLPPIVTIAARSEKEKTPAELTNYCVMSPTKTPAEPDGCNSGS